ncbi:MAG: glucokinase, partial [Chromatiales bacterium]
MELLAGDIGGTNTRLAIYRATAQNRYEALHEQVFPSGEFPDLESILAQFLGTVEQRITRACFGVAGPVIDQTCDA